MIKLPIKSDAPVLSSYELIRKCNNSDESQLQMFVLGFICFIEGFIYIFSLGLLDTDLRAWYLFEAID